MKLSSSVRLIAVSVVVGLMFPAVALADHGQHGAHGHAKAADASGDAKDGPSFPMAGKDFVAHMEKRLSRLQSRIEERLTKKGVSDADKKKRMQEFQVNADKVRRAANKAAADGTVTADEARDVRAVVKEIWKDMRNKHAGNKKDKKKA